ncbi:MAG: 50S ribosomal protein L24 [Phycisphaerae bacterium]|nr:50S ribosomal protein L24 [Phycisphaerae bacterium]
MPAHIRKDDLVMVTSGDYKGAVGKVLRVIPRDERVVVQGVNIVTKHLKPTRTSPQGGVITREAAIHISKVSPVVDGKPSRVRFVVRPDGSKARVAVRGGKELSVVRRASQDRKSPGRK